MSSLDRLFSLQDKTAIVTGASRGLGRAAAEALAAAGANVALVGRDEAALRETIGLIGQDRTSMILSDVKDPESMLSAISSVVERFGTIDILINNAGIIRRSPAIDYSSHDWYDVIDTNLNAVFSW